MAQAMNLTTLIKKGAREIMEFAYGMLAGMYLTILIIAVELRLRKASEK